MVMSTKGNLKMTKRMELELILTVMEHAIKVNLKKIRSTVLGRKPGQTAQVIKDAIKMAKSMGKVSSPGQTRAHTKEILLITTKTVKVSNAISGFPSQSS